MYFADVDNMAKGSLNFMLSNSYILMEDIFWGIKLWQENTYDKQVSLFALYSCNT